MTRQSRKQIERDIVFCYYFFNTILHEILAHFASVFDIDLLTAIWWLGVTLAFYSLLEARSNWRL